MRKESVKPLPIRKQLEKSVQKEQARIDFLHGSVEFACVICFCRTFLPHTARDTRNRVCRMETGTGRRCG